MMNLTNGAMVRVVVETKMGPVRRPATVAGEPRKRQGCVLRRLRDGETVSPTDDGVVPVLFRTGNTVLVPFSAVVAL